MSLMQSHSESEEWPGKNSQESTTQEQLWGMNMHSFIFICWASIVYQALHQLWEYKGEKDTILAHK